VGLEFKASQCKFEQLRSAQICSLCISSNKVSGDMVFPKQLQKSRKDDIHQSRFSTLTGGTFLEENAASNICFEG
jgi:hypothetical protein